MRTSRRRLVVGLALLLGPLGCSTESSSGPPETPAGNYLDFASVAAGLDHSCAISADGTAYCWGRGPTGALGADSVTSAIHPLAVLTDLRFASVTAGEEHTCAIDVQGAEYCWGDGSQGQLGVGDTRGRLRPARGALSHLQFRQLSAGSRHTCGVTVDNRGYCWGWNPFGQIGNNSVIGQVVPVEVHGSLPLAAISASSQHSCGITTVGVAHCWGTGTSGQLGDGSRVSRLSAVVVTGNLQFVAITTGGEHSCALVASGAAYCWGNGEVGQLGDGSTQSSSGPVAVTGGLTFSNIDAGAEHSCGVTRGNQLYCWGHNNFGRLGIGGLPTIIPQPTQVVVDTARFVSVAVGRLHSCALTTDGHLYCWGFGGFGQLGNGSVINRATPTRVLIGTDSL